MNAKSIALTITFAAVATALNTVRIPAIFYPGNFYQISQIPIVVAFLLLGARTGILVGVLTLAGQLALFPLGARGIIVYPMDLVSVLIMFAGLYVASKFIARKASSEKPNGKKELVLLTAFTIAFRGGIMPFIDYGVIFHVLVPLVGGITYPEAAIVGLVPVFVLYNVTTPLYTVPVAYVVAVKVSKYLKIEPRLIRQI